MGVWGLEPADGSALEVVMGLRRRITAWLAAPVATGALALVVPSAAEGDPATPATYPAASSATRTSGRFLDTCTAPALTALAAWRGTSPYTGVNIYFGGRNRGCAQPNLTASWVRRLGRRRLVARADVLR